jgi:plastocyanin
MASKSKQMRCGAVLVQFAMFAPPAGRIAKRERLGESMRGMHTRPRRLLLLVGAVGLVALPAVASSEVTPTVEAVNKPTGGHAWEPPSTTVSEGGNVNIKNPSSSVPHGVEWRSGPETPSCTSGVPVGTSPAASGKNWSGSCVFRKPGTYVFFCTVHGSEMTETVTVKPFTGSAPSVTKVAPAKGPASGGTSVKITGTSFTGATSVKFGSAGASSFKVVSATSVTAVSPSGQAAGTVDITVTTPEGTSAISSADHYAFGPPTVTGLSPKAGTKAGGTSVTVTGTGFAPGEGATIFKFGATAAKSVSCVSTTSCTVTSPAHAVATVDVKATVGKLSSAKNAPADQFTYS